jgi:hypothetical protein
MRLCFVGACGRADGSGLDHAVRTKKAVQPKGYGASRYWRSGLQGLATSAVAVDGNRDVGSAQAMRPDGPLLAFLVSTAPGSCEQEFYRLTPAKSA